jgi:hypothetical protein
VSRLAAAPRMAQAGHKTALPAVLPAATREPGDPLAATQMLAVPLVPHPALDMTQPSHEADMPLWVLLLALTALTFPALASFRMVAQATRRLADRWPPLKALGVIVLAVAPGTASYVVIQRNLRTHVETTPQSIPLAARSGPAEPVPQTGSKPMSEPASPFPATREGRTAFVRTMVSVLCRKGLTHRQALLFAAHLARETGWGRWVRGNNFGNVKVGRGWTGETFSMRDARGFTGQYRAWPTLEQGVESNLALVRNSARYRKAWKLLRAEDVRWYGQLGLDGYYEGPTGHARDGSRFHTEHDLSTVLDVQREYEGIVARAAQFDGGEG